MDDRVAELLEQCEELLDQDQELSAEKLCQDEPELVEACHFERLPDHG